MAKRRSFARSSALPETLRGDLAVALLELDADGAAAEVLRGPQRRA
jgi:hypothetical protein